MKVVIKEGEVIGSINKLTDESINKGLKKIKDFFKDSNIDLEINLINNKKELDKIAGYKTEGCIAGITKGNKIYIYHPSKISKYTCYKKNDFQDMLVFDMVNAYLSDKITSPYWLKEGLSGLIAGINGESLYFEGDLLKSFNEKGFQKNNCYEKSRLFIEYLIKKYGKSLFIDFINKLNKNFNKKKFLLEYRKIFGREFIREYKEWSEKFLDVIKVKKGKIQKGGPKGKVVSNALNQVESFFGKRNLDFEVIFLKERKELDKIRGYKTKKWEIGGYYGEDKIFIFDKEVFDKVSNHPKEYFYSTLVHEITHFYTEKVFNFLYPIWLTEGIAYIVSDQINEIKKHHKKDLNKAYYEKDWNKDTFYTSSAKFTEYLIKRFGKGKIISLMKYLNPYEKKLLFNKKFKEVFGRTFKEVYNNYRQ